MGLGRSIGNEYTLDMGRSQIGLVEKLLVIYVNIVIIIDKCALVCSTYSARLLTYCVW